MNKTLKSALIQFLKAIVKVNQVASLAPGVAFKVNPYLFIAKIIVGFLSVFANWLLISLVAVKETVPTLLKYDPLWIREKLSADEPEQRQIRLQNRIKRSTADFKVSWFTKFGDPDIYLSKIRSPKE
jgi:hypothetical protein